MKERCEVFQYDHREELVNAYTHMLGIFFGVFAFISLVYISWDSGSFVHFFSYFVYSSTLVALFTASTCYHFAKTREWKLFLKKLDHSAIYLSMAGCYTPFVLLHLNTDWKYWFLGLVWGLAVIGIIYKMLSKKRNQFISIGTYLGLGYLCLFAKADMLDPLRPLAFNLLVLGGVAYTVGVLFYIRKKMPYHHGIWHLFTLIGTGLHYGAIVASVTV